MERLFDLDECILCLKYTALSNNSKVNTAFGSIALQIPGGYGLSHVRKKYLHPSKVTCRLNLTLRRNPTHLLRKTHPFTSGRWNPGSSDGMETEIEEFSNFSNRGLLMETRSH